MQIHFSISLTDKNTVKCYKRATFDNQQQDDIAYFLLFSLSLSHDQTIRICVIPRATT